MTTQTSRWTGVCLAVLGLLPASRAHAQDPTGAIEGRVTDTTASPLPGAHVTATRLDSGFSRDDDRRGRTASIACLLLPVGPYRLTVEMPQFVTLVQEPLQVNVSQTVHVNAQLELSTVSETVTVSADAQLVDTSTNALGRVVTGRELVDLPLNGRNFSQLGLLQTGVAPLTRRRRHCRRLPAAGSGLRGQRHAARSRTCTSSTARRTSTAWTAATR